MYIYFPGIEHKKALQAFVFHRIQTQHILQLTIYNISLQSVKNNIMEQKKNASSATQARQSPPPQESPFFIRDGYPVARESGGT